MKTIILTIAVALAMTGCGTPNGEQLRERQQEIEWLTAQQAYRVERATGKPVQVLRVVDGDTVHVWLEGKDAVVRVLGIDTPETKKPNTPVQCGGPQATQFAHQQLDGMVVSIAGDPTQGDADRYGRLLRYVTLPDGSDYSEAITRAGWARSVVYGRKPVQRAIKISQAQHEAQTAKRGIWGLCPIS